MGGRSSRMLPLLVFGLVLMALANAVVDVGPPRNPALYATVTGRVFCDKCNDGERNHGADVPLAHAERLVYDYSGFDEPSRGTGFLQFFDATTVGDSGGALYSTPDSLRTFDQKSFTSVVVGDTVYWIENASPAEDILHILSTRADYVRQPPNYALGAVTAQVPPFQFGDNIIYNFAVDTSELPEDKLYFFFTYSTQLDAFANRVTAIYSAASWRDNPLKVYETSIPESTIADVSIYNSIQIDLYWIEYTTYYTLHSGSRTTAYLTYTLKRASISRSRSTLTYIQSLYSMTVMPNFPTAGIKFFQVDPVHKLLYVQLAIPHNKPIPDVTQYLAVFDISVNPPTKQFTRRIGSNIYHPLVDIYSSPPVMYGLSSQTVYKVRLNLTGSDVLTYGPRLSIGLLDFDQSGYIQDLSLLYGDDCAAS
eukprot:jgi/Chlat1/641/Chrsp103S01050